MSRQSPLIEVAAEQVVVQLDKISITEKPFYSQTILRGRTNDAAFKTAVKTILSVDLNEQANTCIESDGLMVFWMSPDQWLLLTNDESQSKKIAMLPGALEQIHGAVNDVSSGQTIVNVKGEKALELMNKGTTFDVHPGHFKPGQCAQTVFAKMNVLIFPRETDNHNEFDIIVRRSFSDFLGRWLINACNEYKG